MQTEIFSEESAVSSVLVQYVPVQKHVPCGICLAYPLAWDCNSLLTDLSMALVLYCPVVACGERQAACYRSCCSCSIYHHLYWSQVLPIAPNQCHYTDGSCKSLWACPKALHGNIHWAWRDFLWSVLVVCDPHRSGYSTQTMDHHL